MPASPTTRPRRRPRRVLALLAALTAAAVALPVGGATAGPKTPAPSPVPDRIVLGVSGDLDLPSAPGSPDLLLEAGAPVDLTVTFTDGALELPYSTRTATTVALTVSDGRTLPTAVVPAGASSVVVEDVTFPAANDVTITATAVGRRPAADLARATVGPFDVVIDAASIPIPVKQRGTSVSVSATNTPGPCEADERVQTCVDVVLPNGVDSDVFFSTGVCTGTVGCRAQDARVLQVLADLEDAAGPLYERTAPATLIVRCDKSLCGGGSIRQNPLLVSLEAPFSADEPTAPRALLSASPPCGAKGVMDGGDGHCVDYVQSKRDGTGDTYFYLLITQDVRMSW